ncbi:uncharacterized protein FIBRA_08941 [Fibroporia radiculosa]|uniref:Uncharacterized protein n=1 Tax=Fibroporia radiculosa TaxID=599839 RepID=J4I3K0_9APHY|nr:uncharacterized protein FIBRA_08941 [Fibroporia radiculosa]CCM06657.1 predicted protein [Fibroporia radiculosa]
MSFRASHEAGRRASRGTSGSHLRDAGPHALVRLPTPQLAHTNHPASPAAPQMPGAWTTETKPSGTPPLAQLRGFASRNAFAAQPGVAPLRPHATAG